MKRLTLLLLPLLVLGAHAINAQDLAIGDNYYFISTGGAPNVGDQNEAPPDSAKTRSTKIQIKARHRVEITYLDSDVVYFRYLNFTDTFSKLKYNTIKSANDERDLIFNLPKNEFLKITRPLYDLDRGFLFGPYTVPIRLRSRDSGTLTGDHFEFESNLLLGANVIYRRGLSRKRENLYLDFSLGIGLTKVNLNAENSDLGSSGAFEKVEALSPSAITFSLGVLTNLSKNVNLGFYLGSDRLSSADQKTNWIFNRKIWFGVGINVSLGTGANTNNSPVVDSQSKTEMTP